MVIKYLFNHFYRSSRMALEKKIAKHLAIIFFPPIIICGILAIVTDTPGSQFHGGSLEKGVIQGFICICLILYVAFLVAFYYKSIEERCRSPRQIEYIDVQPYRMQPHYRRLPCRDPSRQVITIVGGVVYEDTCV